MYEASVGLDSVSIKKRNGKEVSEIAIHLLNMIPDEIIQGKTFIICYSTEKVKL